MYDRSDRHFCPPNVYSFPSLFSLSACGNNYSYNTLSSPEQIYLCILGLFSSSSFIFLKGVKILSIQKVTVNLNQVFSFMGTLSARHLNTWATCGSHMFRARSKLPTSLIFLRPFFQKNNHRHIKINKKQKIRCLEGKKYSCFHLVLFS